MKVHELRDLLSKVDGELDVVLSQDGEGNAFSPLAAMGPGHYHAYHGRVVLDGEFMPAGDFGLVGRPDETVNAVCLWPAR